ncbi:CbrC family protein [Burkholderia aenigmatica]|uniref:CbrC family protein n=1 Tax=Burkholderia aenigmatica TaxID=2015348 RepID=UPI002650FC9B|nr:CbrC family protein [Burkholderia aenigmatica]MDN7881225.1 CbrC family protein [Burkholderia aenigmatica]
MSLPAFRYHPDPLATGSVIRSDARCVCCGAARGYVYAGPVYAVDEYEQCICPWCIADGSAHARLDAAFTDNYGIGGGEWDAVPDAVVDEIACRTPGFQGWQQERWWTHCGDGAQFIGRAGAAELTALGLQAVASIRESTGLDEGGEWVRFFAALDKDGSPTAYMFRCLHCGELGGYQDCD